MHTQIPPPPQYRPHISTENRPYRQCMDANCVGHNACSEYSHMFCHIFQVTSHCEICTSSSRTSWRWDLLARLWLAPYTFSNPAFPAVKISLCHCVSFFHVIARKILSGMVFEKWMNETWIEPFFFHMCVYLQYIMSGELSLVLETSLDTRVPGDLDVLTPTICRRPQFDTHPQDV